MSDYERRKEAADFVARKIVENSRGKVNSDEAHKKAAEIAREQDKKTSNKKDG